MHVLAGEVVGVFAHVERADQHGAGGFQALDQCCVTRRRRTIAVDLRARACGETRNVEQVLHREGHTGERTNIEARGNRLVDLVRALFRTVGDDIGE